MNLNIMIWLTGVFFLTVSVSAVEDINNSTSNNNNDGYISYKYDDSEPYGNHHHQENRKGGDWIPSALNEVIKRKNKRLSFLEHYTTMDRDEKIKTIEFKEKMDKEEVTSLKHEIGQLQEIVNSFRQPAESSIHSISKRQTQMKNPASCSTAGNCVILGKFCPHPDRPIKMPDFVLFVVQQSLSQCSSNKPASVVQFETIVLNSSLGAFDLKESVFIAQKSGIYEFNFDGHKPGTKESLNISLRINGKESVNAWSHFIGYDHVLNMNHSLANIISMHALLKLNKGDRIDIYNKEGSLEACKEGNAVQLTQFTGKLLLEDVVSGMDSRKDATKKLIAGDNKHRFSVFFNVQKNVSYCNLQSAVPFEIVNINVGGGFDLSRQVFVSPLAGIYEFTLKGHKTGKQEVMEIYIRLNGFPVASTLADFAPSHDYHAHVSVNSILRIEKGDRIDIFLKKGCLYDDIHQYTQFTGKLLLVENNSTSSNRTNNTIRTGGNSPSPSVADPSVYFYVQKNASFSITNAVIPFEVVALNIGGSFNMSEHFFTAPKSCIYEFNAAGLKGANVNYILYIALRLNNKPVTYVWTDWLGNHYYFKPHFSLHCILKLKKGDRIDLFNVGEGSTMYDNSEKNTHFTGKLLFADDS